jgi:hypothetical protein
MSTSKIIINISRKTHHLLRNLFQKTIEQLTPIILSVIKAKCFLINDSPPLEEHQAEPGGVVKQDSE